MVPPPTRPSPPRISRPPQAYAKGQELQAAGRRSEAIDHYKEAIRLDPNLGRAYSGAAAQYVGLGRSDEAEKYYQEALARIDRMTDRERYPDARELLPVCPQGTRGRDRNSAHW